MAALAVGQAKSEEQLTAYGGEQSEVQRLKTELEKQRQEHESEVAALQGKLAAAHETASRHVAAERQLQDAQVASKEALAKAAKMESQLAATQKELSDVQVASERANAAASEAEKAAEERAAQVAALEASKVGSLEKENARLKKQLKELDNARKAEAWQAAEFAAAQQEKLKAMQARLEASDGGQQEKEEELRNVKLQMAASATNQAAMDRLQQEMDELRESLAQAKASLVEKDEQLAREREKVRTCKGALKDPEKAAQAELRALQQSMDEQAGVLEAVVHEVRAVMNRGTTMTQQELRCMNQKLWKMHFANITRQQC